MTQKIYAIVLAAGEASRFGSAKQLAAVDGKPMAVRAVESAAAACDDHAILVVGHEASAVSAACEGAPGFIVVNNDYGNGMGTSIAAAMKCLPAGADAVLITLADQPLVTAAHLQALVDAWSGEDHEIIASGFAGTQGPPALFARASFESLAGLSGDEGARKLFQDSRFSVTTVICEPAALDVDTTEDLRQISRSARS
jgi:CTP:molybdopterin cytidylyltransferase MocA